MSLPDQLLFEQTVQKKAIDFLFEPISSLKRKFENYLKNEWNPHTINVIVNEKEINQPTVIITIGDETQNTVSTQFTISKTPDNLLEEFKDKGIL